MAKNGKAAQVATEDVLTRIKRTALVAMFADDELMDLLVLKGGNAMDLVHKVSSRASVDLDFSVEDDLDVEDLQRRVSKSLQGVFAAEGYLAFDIKITQKPGKMPEDLAAFWGGYLVEFKLIEASRADDLKHDLDSMRRQAVKLGEGPKFTMDISRHEYVADKQQVDIDGYTVYVYSPAMIVCEKLRAICQQMPEYAEIVTRAGLGNQRARDFVDIEAVVRMFNIDMRSERVLDMLRQMFEMKRVPLALLGKIASTRDFHRLGFDGVRAAMRAGVEVQAFDYYFDFVVGLLGPLEALWHVEPPALDV